MLRITRLLAPGLRMAFAARRSQHDVVCRDFGPIRLVQVLADVDRVRVIGAVPLNGDRPVVGRPDNVDAGIAGTGGPSAETGE